MLAEKTFNYDCTNHAKQTSRLKSRCSRTPLVSTQLALAAPSSIATLRSPQQLFLLFFSSTLPDLLHDLLLSLDGALTAPQSNETTKLSAFLLQSKAFAPDNRAWIMCRPSAWCPLMVEVCEVVKLIAGQQPEVEERGRKLWMDFARCDSNERGKWKCHLCDFGLEVGVV